MPTIHQNNGDKSLPLHSTGYLELAAEDSVVAAVTLPLLNLG